MGVRERVVLLLLAGVVACGGEDPPGPPAGGAGGTGGAAGAGGSGSDLCAKACASTATCDPQADVVACKAQCEKEVGGAGHLQAPVALGYFEQFAALENDQECLYSKGGFAWLWCREYDTPTGSGSRFVQVACSSADTCKADQNGVFCTLGAEPDPKCAPGSIATQPRPSSAEAATPSGGSSASRAPSPRASGASANRATRVASPAQRA